MYFFVYIIQSQVDGTFYKGFSKDYHKRLEQHNEGWGKFTSRKRPWKLIYVESFHSKNEALLREKSIKKYSNKQLVELIKSNKNIMHKGPKEIPNNVGD